MVIQKAHEVGSCTKGRKLHCFHDSDRQPNAAKYRKWQVCCYCGNNRELVAVVMSDKDHGRYNPEPILIWPKEEDVEEKSKETEEELKKAQVEAKEESKKNQAKREKKKKEERRERAKRLRERQKAERKS